MRSTLAILALTLLVCSTALARPIHFFHADMDGLQETPPNASPASGFADLTVDDVTLDYAFHMEFAGLIAPQTASHIHTAPVGVAGPVTIPVPVGSPSDLIGVLTATQYANLLAGLLYINVHSTVFPGGEIRGQFSEVPEPASAGLLIGAGLLALKRRVR
ncbi:MAG: CHRD domain-containing protein [Tepidisphaeraceae bacterium]